MRHSACWILACLAVAGLGMTCAAGGATADDRAELLMIGNGAGTSFKARGRNSKGARFGYQACHHPDGRIVARSDYGANKVYHASGLWKAEEGRICVDWSTEGWIDGCFSVAHTQAGYEMTNVADGRTVIEEGAFENGYLDWCDGRF